jgi:hypothetical protein
MGHTFSVHDCHKLVDLKQVLGKPKIYKRINVSRELYVWDHYTALVREYDGEILKLTE